MANSMTSSPDAAEKVVAEWRAAMEGVTPGPWKAVCRPDFSNGYTYTSVQPVEPDREKLNHLAMANGEFHVCRMTHTPLERKFRLYERDATFIARCSPSGISGLLSLIESQRATIERVERERDEARALSAAQNGGNRHASAEWTKTLLKLRETQKERDAILAAGEVLSLALSRYGFPMSDEAWRNTGDAAPTNSQASVEARALHRAAAAFFREVSGAANVG